MAKRTMSPEARARIAAAQRKRWAAVRRKKKGRAAKKTSAKIGSRGRRGRPRKGTGSNPYLKMSIGELVEAKRQIDEAWSTAAKALGG